MSIKSNNHPVAENIAKIISEAGLKQGIVAEKAGFSVQEFSGMLNGRKLIKMCDVQKIAKVLNVTPNDLYGISKKEETEVEVV